MSEPILEILDPLRAAVLGEAPIVALVGRFVDAPSVFTARPVPVEAGYPMIVIGPVITRTDTDGINDYRPRVGLDVNVYGELPRDKRVVDDIAGLVRRLFHRRPRSITVQHYSCTLIRCLGPSPAPVDDDKQIGRRVTLTIDLYAK